MTEVAEKPAIDRSRLGRRSKNKGANYEREIRDVLKKAWGVVLQRTPLSGGFQKGISFARIKGDLNTMDPNVELLVHLELKNQKTWSIHAWWKQTLEDCPKGKIPILVMHQGQENKDGKRVKEAEDFVLLKMSDFLDMVSVDKVLVRKDIVTDE